MLDGGTTLRGLNVAVGRREIARQIRRIERRRPENGGKVLNEKKKLIERLQHSKNVNGRLIGKTWRIPQMRNKFIKVEIPHTRR